MVILNIISGIILSYIGGVTLVSIGIIIVLAVYSGVKKIPVNKLQEAFDYEGLIKTASILGIAVGAILFILSGGLE